MRRLSAARRPDRRPAEPRPAAPAAPPASPHDAGGTATRAKGGVALKKIGRFDHPVYVAGAPGFPKLLFVVEQPGRVVVLQRRQAPARTRSSTSRGSVGYDGGERGLLSIAFPPDYRQQRQLLRLLQRRRRQHPHRRIQAPRRHPGGRRLPAPGDRDPPPGQRQPQRRPDAVPRRPPLLRHRRRRLRRRPAEQRPEQGRAARQAAADRPAPERRPALLGAGSNPFVGKPGRDEIYSYGLRNPFRFSFDTVSAAQPRIAIGDVGQNQFEELDYTTVAAAGGANFGWDALEGFAPYTEESSGTADPGGTTKPIFAYPHSRDGSCSIIGGYVVADRSLRSLYKRYVYADFCEGQLRSLVPHLKRASGDRRLGLAVASPTSFGEDDAHHLYVASLEGPVFRLVPR